MACAGQGQIFDLPTARDARVRVRGGVEWSCLSWAIRPEATACNCAGGACCQTASRYCDHFKGITTARNGCGGEAGDGPARQQCRADLSPLGRVALGFYFHLQNEVMIKGMGNHINNNGKRHSTIAPATASAFRPSSQATRPVLPTPAVP